MAFFDNSQKCFITNNNTKQSLLDTSLNASLDSFSEFSTDDSLNKYLNYVRVIRAHKFQAWQYIATASYF
jgi:hypothetical protein